MKRLVVSIIVALAVWFVFASWLLWPTDYSGWRQLERGMTAEQVAELLGEPNRIKQRISHTFWDYPRFGFVCIDDDDGLFVWDEPRW